MRLHRIGQLEPRHIVFGRVGNDIGDCEGFVLPYALVIDDHVHGKPRHDESLDHKARRGLARKRSERGFAGLLVECRNRLLPAERIDGLLVELVVSDRHVIEMELARAACRNGDRVVDLHLFIGIAAGKHRVGHRIIGLRIVADGEKKVRDLALALQLGRFLAGHGQRDRMLAVGSAKRSRQACRQQKRRC